MTEKSITVRVPASTSNVGAGFDCLGIALDLYLTVRLHPGAGPPRYSGTMSGLVPADDLISARLGPTGALQRFCLEVSSDIPIGRGLGSSAAAYAAAEAIRQVLADTPEDRRAIFLAVREAEGHPDNAAPAVYGGARLVVGDDQTAGADALLLTIHPGIGIALAVPDLVVETKAARARLPASYPRATAIAQASRAAALVHGLRDGDPAAVRAGMRDQLAVPYRSDLIPGYDQAVEAAASAGAWGATISGGGSTLLALAPHRRVQAVADAMVSALAAASVPATPLTPAIDQQGIVVVR